MMHNAGQVHSDSAMTDADPQPRIERLSESQLIIRLGNGIDAALNRRVQALAERISRAALVGIVDVAPAYASVAVRYQPLAWQSAQQSAFDALSAALLPLCVALDGHANTARLIEIPVCYGGDAGIDLESAAGACGISVEALIQAHAGARYRVAMLGFAPGFAYLLGLPPQLHLPRRAAPRLRVPAGSVAIGGAQSGIYPSALPGGWHLIGRTPLRLFDAAATPPSLLAPGDEVRFQVISARQLADWPEVPLACA